MGTNRRWLERLLMERDDYFGMWESGKEFTMLEKTKSPVSWTGKRKP